MHNGIVKFYRPSCKPCNIQDTYLLALKADIIKINIQDYPEHIDSLNILSVPTLVKYEDGVEISRLTGMTSKEKLEKWLLS